MGCCKGNSKHFTVSISMLHLHRLKLELDFFVTEQYCSNLLFCVRGDGIVRDAVKYTDNSRLESNI